MPHRSLPLAVIPMLIISSSLIFASSAHASQSELNRQAHCTAAQRDLMHAADGLSHARADDIDAYDVTAELVTTPGLVVHLHWTAARPTPPSSICPTADDIRTVSDLTSSIDIAADDVRASKLARDLDLARTLLQTAIDNARALLTSSEGLTLHDATRAALARSIVTAQAAHDMQDVGRPDDLDRAGMSLSEPSAQVQASMTERRRQEELKRQPARTTVRSGGSAQRTTGDGTRSAAAGPSAANGYRTGASCTTTGGYDQCQGAIDQGGLTRLNGRNGTTIYAQHDSSGGSWIGRLAVGEQVTVNGRQVTVSEVRPDQTHIRSDGGTYLQTCVNGRNTIVKVG